MYPIVVNTEYCTTHNSRLNEGNKNCSVQIRFNFRADHGIQWHNLLKKVYTLHKIK